MGGKWLERLIDRLCLLYLLWHDTSVRPSFQSARPRPPARAVLWRDPLGSGLPV